MFAKISGLDVERFVAVVLVIYFRSQSFTQALQLFLSGVHARAGCDAGYLWDRFCLIFAVLLGLTAYS